MKTQSKIGVVSLILLASGAAPGKEGVILECPAQVVYTPTSLPAGWSNFQTVNQPFREAAILEGKIFCYYGSPNCPLAGDIVQPVPKGMTCKVNPSSARQFDCLPKK